MSHELRTPLERDHRLFRDDEAARCWARRQRQYRAYVGDIHASGTHLLQIINDILDLSKAEAGKLTLDEDSSTSADAMRSVVQLTSVRAQEGGLEPDGRHPADLPLLRGDERKTMQIVLNLVTNAIKFSPAGGSIEIVCRGRSGRGTVDRRHRYRHRHRRKKISGACSKPSSRSNSSLSRKQQGTGLGLPLVRAMMELHGGTFELTSAVGVGTEAKIIFPRDRLVYARRAMPPRHRR